MTRLCFDIDAIIFDAVSVAEEKFVTCTHKPTGQVLELDNTTALWGHHGKKEGGWIGLKNSVAGTDYYKASDFEVVPGHRPRPFRVKGKVTGIDENGNEVRAEDTFMTPVEGAKMIVDERINMICGKLKCFDYFGFTGEGTVFRHDIATLLPYKGNREGMLRPLILDEIKTYVCERHNCKMVHGIEADDAVSMATVAAYKAWKAGGKQDKDKVIAVAVDKDAKQTEGWHYNFNKDETPRLIEGFGSLWLDAKGKVDGAGRMWLYFQVMCGDASDNYKANCFSDVKWAEKGAYGVLKDCTTDKEAFEAMLGAFKKLYPEEKTVEGCKGPVKIDALYVMQECFTLAMMLRHDGDSINVKTVLHKLGVSYA